MKALRIACALAVGVAAWVASPRAEAQSGSAGSGRAGSGRAGGGATPEASAKARRLFNGGVASFKSRDFRTAARLFDEAYALVEKPALLFSSAQSLRREYEATEDENAARAAISRYQRYLSLVSSGGRRVDAKRSLVDLQRLVGAGEGGGVLARDTVVQVNSPVAGAVARLDGGALRALPFSATIEPGEHSVEVFATGYATRTESFAITKNEILVVPVPLKGQAPKLEVIASSGAEVTVDGVSRGEVPFARPVALEPGRHLVVVSEAGYEAYVEELDFVYGSQTEIEVDLPMTGQRRAAWAVMGTGAAIFAGGLLVGGFGLSAQSDAQEIDDRRQAEGSISREDAERFNDLIDERDRLFGGGASLAGLGVLVAGTGLLLYLFDEPDVKAPPPSSPGDEEGEEAPDDDGDDAEGADEVELMASPVVVPGWGGRAHQWGVSLQGRF
ncbi:MAG: PEGA domain-containing protein [Myxococcota bacterium]